MNIKRNQVTIFTLLIFFVTAVVLVALLPAFTEIINTGVAASTGSTMTISVLQLFIPLLCIGVLFSFLLYVAPRRQEGV